MSDSMVSPSVLIISDDVELIETLIISNNTGQEFIARDSLQIILDDPALLDNNSIVIFDTATTHNHLNTSIDQILKIKQLDPTQILMLTGESNSLGDLLKSVVQPLVYRAFTKPISANQAFLAFKSANTLHADLVAKRATGVDISAVGPAENKTNVASLVSERKNKPVLYAAITIAVLAVVAWLLLVNDDSSIKQNPAQEVALDETISSSEQEEEPSLITESASTQRIKQLNQQAATAIQEERLIAPKGANALEYYDQVLHIDAYDSTAYQGKKEIADQLRVSYNLLVVNAAFDRALKVIKVLRRIEPLNLQNDALQEGLEKAIDAHVKQIRSSGTSAQIAKTALVLEKMGPELAASKTATKALQAEKALLTKIDAALHTEDLIPPKKVNAYTLVSKALKANTVSKANMSPRVRTLSKKLVQLASESVTQGNLEEAINLAGLAKILNVDKKGLAALNSKIEQSKTASVAQAAEVEQAKQEPAKIIPAKIISRTPPSYPARALRRGVEGWVEVRFAIDTKGKPVDIKVVNAQPKGMFDSAALKAVVKWRYSPERNESSGLAVKSEPIVNKVSFKFE